jgi:hypothetical protein
MVFFCVECVTIRSPASAGIAKAIDNNIRETVFFIGFHAISPSMYEHSIKPTLSFHHVSEDEEITKESLCVVATYGRLA